MADKSSDDLAETIAAIAKEAIREAPLQIDNLPTHRRQAVRQAILLAALKGIKFAKHESAASGSQSSTDAASEARHPSGSGPDTARQDEQKSPRSDRAAQQEPAILAHRVNFRDGGMPSAWHDGAELSTAAEWWIEARPDIAYIEYAYSRSGGAAALSEARPQDSVHQVDAPATPLPLGSDASRTE